MSSTGPWPPPHDPSDPETGAQPSYESYPSSDATSSGQPYYQPFPAPGPYQPAPPPQQPDSIRTAVRLMWAGAALSVVSLVTTLATLGSLKSKLRQQVLDADSTVTPQDFENVYHATIAITVFFSFIAVALWLWMAWKNGQGRRWARIVATVLGGLNLLASFYTLTSGTSVAISMILTLLNLVLAAVILFLLWRKESSAFYAASRAARLR